MTDAFHFEECLKKGEEGERNVKDLFIEFYPKLKEILAHLKIDKESIKWIKDDIKNELKKRT